MDLDKLTDMYVTDNEDDAYLADSIFENNKKSMTKEELSKFMLLLRNKVYAKGYTARSYRRK